MKTLKTTILSILILSSLALAQISFGVKGIYSNPSGDVKDLLDLKSGFGGGIYGELTLPLIPVTPYAEVSYVSYSSDNDVLKDIKFNFLTVHVGAKYYFAPIVYGLVEFGPNMMTFEYNTIDNSETKFGYAIGAGACIPLAAFKLDAGVKYNMYYSDFKGLDIYAGLKFGL